jgi:hypothetical protein
MRVLEKKMSLPIFVRGIISLPKSITSVHIIPATLSLGIIILPKSITSEGGVPEM